MKKFLKNNVFLFITLLFLFLLFRYNATFKACILNGCLLFLQQVFPFLFPMFLLNDLFINYHFDVWIEKTIYKLLHPIFHFSPLACSVFILSMFCGTPTNAYMIQNLVKRKELNTKEASIILSYSCFLNPLFLYAILTSIFENQSMVWKFILIQYLLNFVIAFFFRKFPYESQKKERNPTCSFSSLLPKSIQHSMETLLLILGTILFYLLLCEGLNLFIKNPLLNCIVNGFLETTGGLMKLEALNINLKFKAILASLFVSFMGFSIHTQIQNSIEEEGISYRPFFYMRILHTFLSTGICIIVF